jgi:serine/threonine-protein kinase
MSVVYLAQDLRLGRRVALKLIAPELADHLRFRERFLRESRLAASLDHQNVVPIYEAGEAAGLLYIAMRYVEGTDLKELLRAQGPLAPARTVSLLAQVAGALDAAHERGLVHRDVKPGNVLIAADGHAYLSDFGLTKQSASESGVTETGQFVGSVDYVAPEQIERQPVDGRADVYSLACVLYECLTGEPPYHSNSLTGALWAHLSAPPPSTHAARPELPAAIDAVIAKGMAKKPSERYQSCSELVRAAQVALGVSGELTAPPAAPARRRRRLLALAALALALIAAAVAIPLALTGGDGNPAAAAANTKPTLAITADSIQHIDPDTNTLVGTTRIGTGSTAALAVRELSEIGIGEGAVWAIDQYSNRLYRISARRGEITGRVATGSHPIDVAVGFGHVWVVISGDADPAAGAVIQIDPDTLYTRELSFTGKHNLVGPVAIGEHNAWVGTTDPRGWLWWKESNPPYASGNVKTPPAAGIPLLTAASDVLWIASYRIASSGQLGGRLERVDESSRRYLGSTDLEFVPHGLAAGDRAVWLSDARASELVRIDAATREVVKRIPVGNNPTAVAHGAGSVWVTNYDDGTVSRIDPATNAVVATIEVGPHPDHIAAGESGVWVAVHP